MKIHNSPNGQPSTPTEHHSSQPRRVECLEALHASRCKREIDQPTDGPLPYRRSIHPPGYSRKFIIDRKTVAAKWVISRRKSLPAVTFDCWRPEVSEVSEVSEKSRSPRR